MTNDTEVDRRRSFFDRTISMSTVIWVISIVFGLGVIFARFNILESTVGQLLDKESNLATIESVKIVQDRLDKKIIIVNENTNDIHELELRLVELETLLKMKDSGGS